MRPDKAGSYGDAAGYDAYMGGWSRNLAPPFLDFAAPQRTQRFLDVGCGTGSLLVALQERFPHTKLAGIDPSGPQLARARGLLSGVELIEGVAEALPFPDEAFDACLSLLVLHEFTDLSAIVEMRRVTHAGGIVASCQWDFLHMPVIATLLASLRLIETDPTTGLANAAPTSDDSGREMERSWREAGMRDVTTRRITISHTYGGFHELWVSLMAGSTPSTRRLAVLSYADRATVRTHMRSALSAGIPDGPLTLTAAALAVRGRA
ncbi:MAG: class I SAM-dependent methyltransferase [Alphaproteobacteria bacterium]